MFYLLFRYIYDCVFEAGIPKDVISSFVITPVLPLIEVIVLVSVNFAFAGTLVNTWLLSATANISNSIVNFHHSGRFAYRKTRSPFQRIHNTIL